MLDLHSVKITVFNSVYIYHQESAKFLSKVDNYIGDFRAIFSFFFRREPLVYRDVVEPASRCGLGDESSKGEGKVDHQNAEMKIFINRLASYQSWPDNVLMSALVLSNNGFYYTGNMDRVKCYQCGITIGNWVATDEPFQRHRVASPNCPAVKAQENSFNGGAMEEPPGHDMKRVAEPPGHDMKHVAEPPGHDMKRVAEPPEHDVKRVAEPRGHDVKRVAENSPMNHYRNNETHNVHQNSDVKRVSHRENTRKQIGDSKSLPQRMPNLMHSESKKIGENAVMKHKPVIQEDECTNIQQTENTVVLGNSETQDRSNSCSPLNIRSTKEALNVLTNTPTTLPNNWYTPRDTANQPTTSQQIDYTIATNRLASFVGHWSSNAFLKPDELVDAGLYFTGPGDRVQCAWCRGGLYNWEQGDTAIGEHIRHFPECPFIKNKMSEMVREPVSSTTVSTTRNERRMEEGAGNGNTSYNSVVKIVCDVGYSEEMVQKAIDRLVSTGCNKVTVDKVLDVVFELENNVNEEKAFGSPEGAIGNVNLIDNEHDELVTKPVNNNQEKVISNITYEQNTNSAHHHNVDLPVTSNVKEPSDICQELNALTEENSQLTGKTICKVCLDSEVNTLFLPCRHLVCCEECGSALQHCPVCRTLIVGTVKTFLS